MTQAVAKKQDALQLLGSKDMQQQLANALPKHLTPSRMLRLVTTEIRKNPDLAKCNPWSIVGCVVQCAQLGLEPGSGLGHAYLIPYKDECTLIPGYKGLAELARRTGKITAITAHLVYKTDTFKHGIRNGEEFLDWVPSEDPDDERIDDAITHVIAMAKFANGATQYVVMRRREIEKIRNGLRYVSKIWKEHFGEMAKKTAIRRLAKLLPQSPDFVQIQALDDAASDGSQMRLNMDALIEAEVVTPEVADKEVAEQEERHRKATGEEIRSAKDTAPPVETPKENFEKATNRLGVIAEFDEAYTVAKNKGLKLGDALKMLGMEADKVRNQPIEEIETATDILLEWTKGRP